MHACMHASAHACVCACAWSPFPFPLSPEPVPPLPPLDTHLKQGHMTVAMHIKELQRGVGRGQDQQPRAGLQASS